MHYDQNTEDSIDDGAHNITINSVSFVPYCNVTSQMDVTNAVNTHAGHLKKTLMIFSIQINVAVYHVQFDSSTMHGFMF